MRFKMSANNEIVNAVQKTARELGIDPIPSVLGFLMGIPTENIINGMVSQVNHNETKKGEI